MLGDGSRTGKLNEGSPTEKGTAASLSSDSKLIGTDAESADVDASATGVGAVSIALVVACFATAGFDTGICNAADGECRDVDVLAPNMGADDDDADGGEAGAGAGTEAEGTLVVA